MGDLALLRAFDSGEDFPGVDWEGVESSSVEGDLACFCAFDLGEDFPNGVPGAWSSMGESISELILSFSFDWALSADMRALDLGFDWDFCDGDFPFLVPYTW